MKDVGKKIRRSAAPKESRKAQLKKSNLRIQQILDLYKNESLWFATFIHFDDIEHFLIYEHFIILHFVLLEKGKYHFCVKHL